MQKQLINLDPVKEQVKQKLIEKLNGQYPTTMLNDNMTALFDIE